MDDNKSQKDIAAQLLADAMKGKPALPGDNNTPEDKHQIELTAQIKESNPDKSDDDITKLVNKKLTQEKTNQKNLTAKLAEIKGRPENKDKSDDDISAILKEELNKPAGKAPEDPPAKPKTLNELIKEASKGTFADIDALLSKANEPKNVFANDQIKHLNDLATKGVDLADIFKYQSLGIDNLDPSDLEQAKELIKHELRLKNPGISEKELEYEMRFSYPLELKSETYKDDDGDEQTRVINTDEVENSKLKLMRNARVAKEALQQKQKDAELPKATSGLTQEENDKLQRQWGENVDDNLKDLTEVSFKVGKKGEETFKYKIEDIDNLRNIMSEPDRFLARYRNNGQTDMAKFQQDMLAISEMPNIVKSAFEQGTSVGYENAINGISNLSTDTDGGGAGSTYEPKTPAQAIAKKFKAEVGGY